MLTARYLIKEIRNQLDQYPLDDEDVRTDSSILGSTSTLFSDENLLERLNQAQINIVSLVKAQHVPRAIGRYEGPFPELPTDVVRLLRSRVFYSGGTTTNNPFAAWDPQGYFSGVADPYSTIFSFVASRRVYIHLLSIVVGQNPTTNTTFSVLRNSETMGTATVHVSGDSTVALPSFWMKVGDVLSVRAGANNTAGDITVAFTADAEVLIEEQSSGVRARQRPVARNRRMEYSDRAGTEDFPVYTFEDGELNVFPDDENAFCFFVRTPRLISSQDLQVGTDELDLDERLEEAIIYHVVGSCYQTLRRPDLVAEYMEDYADVLDAYSINNRMNPMFDDKEVDVE